MIAATPSTLDANDRRQLFWLAMIHYGEAVLMAVFGVICLGLVLLGLWARDHAAQLNLTSEQVSATTLLVDLSVGMLLSSWIPAILVALAGWFIIRGKARTFCSVVAVAQAIVLFPLGTGVTAYYFKVMARPNIKAMFRRNGPP